MGSSRLDLQRGQYPSRQIVQLYDFFLFLAAAHHIELVVSSDPKIFFLWVSAKLRALLSHTCPIDSLNLNAGLDA